MLRTLCREWREEQSATNATLLILSVSIGMIVVLSSIGSSAIALPPLEDMPEEVLRTEMITAARSPIDGKPLTAAQYAQLQAQLQTSPVPKLDPKIRENIFLLRLRSALRLIFPFLNF